MVIYEWADVKYLGKETTPDTDDDLPVRVNLPNPASYGFH